MRTDNSQLIIHPIRLQLIRALANRPLSIAQLLDEVKNVPIATAYRHINKLLDAGLIYVFEERIVKGTVERIFALPKKELMDTDALHNASKEDQFNFFSTFIATLLDDYKHYLEDEDIHLPKDGVGYRSMQLYLSDQELAAMAKDLHEAILPYMGLEPKRGRIARIFSTVLVPKKSESRRKNECAS